MYSDEVSITVKILSVGKQNALEQTRELKVVKTKSLLFMYKKTVLKHSAGFLLVGITLVEQAQSSRSVCTPTIHMSLQI